MSGGSWDYCYVGFEDVARRLESEDCPYRRAFGALVKKVSHEMHEIEWVDSCDKSHPSDTDAIKKVIGDNILPFIREELIADVEKLGERVAGFRKELEEAQCPKSS